MTLEINPDINGLRICMTGRGPAERAELVVLLQAHDCIVQSKVVAGGATDLLICSNPDANTVKLRAAREAGVRVTSYDAVFIDA